MRYEDMPKANGFYCDESIAYTDPNSAMMSEDRLFEPAPTGIQFHDSLAYHVENEFFVAYLEQWATRIGVRILDDTVREVRQNETAIASLELESGASES